MPPQPLLTLRIIWAAITTTTFVLFGLLFVLVHAHRPPPGPMAPLFGVVAIASLVVSVVLPRTALRRNQHSGRARVQAHASAAIMGLAITESVAILGFALGFLGHDVVVFTPFFVLAWIGCLLRFPRPLHPLGFLGPPFSA